MKILSLCLLMACFACGTDDAASTTDETGSTDTTETTTGETSADTSADETDETTSDETTETETDTETDTETETSDPDTTEPDTTEPETETETDPSEEPDGSSPTSCGHAAQGLEPVDCTAHGDVNAFCVFSNHCHCSVDEGFECEEESEFGGPNECVPGSTCIPTSEG